MDLYDDIDTKPKTSQIDGCVKYQNVANSTGHKKGTASQSKGTDKKLVHINGSSSEFKIEKVTMLGVFLTKSDNKRIISAQPLVLSLENVKTDDWDFADEYDPLWPNEYENVTIPYSASSVATKILAKFSYKDGQGLGKQEQGMYMALQVEKTSKRGGRIIVLKLL